MSQPCVQDIDKPASQFQGPRNPSNGKPLNFKKWSKSVQKCIKKERVAKIARGKQKEDKQTKLGVQNATTPAHEESSQRVCESQQHQRNAGVRDITNKGLNGGGGVVRSRQLARAPRRNRGDVLWHLARANYLTEEKRTDGEKTTT
eukprot:5757809-Amphidinium_carterae.1